MSKKVTVIIPCRNEEKYIGKCVESFIRSDYPKDLLEVLFFDGMSDDNTRTILTAYAHVPYIKFFDNPSKTTPQAVNLGIKKATGEVIILFGSHAEIYPDYISKCVAVLESDPAIGCAGGVLENVIEDDTSSVIAKAMSSPFGVGSAHFRTGIKEGFVDTVAFGAYKRAAIEKTGLFNEELIRNQDDEFNFRLAKAGYKIYLSHSIRSKYFVRASYQKLSRQYFQYGYWKVYVNKKHNAITTWRQLVPPAFVLLFVSGIIVSVLAPKFLGVFLASLAAYALMGLFASIGTRASLLEIPMVLYTFALLHFSYGTGYLNGVFDFVFNNKLPSSNAAKLTR